MSAKEDEKASLAFGLAGLSKTVGPSSFSDSAEDDNDNVSL